MKRVLAALMMLVLILPSTCYSMSYREGDKKTSGQDNIAPSINTSCWFFQCLPYYQIFYGRV